jgi:hypothetical protein
MIYSIHANWNGTDQGVSYSDLPDECPLCQKGIRPMRVASILTGGNKPERMQIVYQCPRDECGDLFIATYSTSDTNAAFFVLRKVEPKRTRPERFPEEIEKVSSSFVRIYNAAIGAETDLEGMGIRKALEFLVKDFEISHHPQHADRIRKLRLGPVIDEFCDDTKLKAAAKRATWLGNDETHYTRIWTDKDVTDLKKLVRITVSWIEREILTAELEQEMPDPKASAPVGSKP